MLRKKNISMAAAGLCAGAVTGLLGAGGGMVLVPLLCAITDLGDDEIFPASVSIILPISVVCLLFSRNLSAFSTGNTWFLLAGSALGGIAAGLWGKLVPVTWLHRILGILILWGGVRYLC